MNAEYRKEVRRLASEADWSAATVNSPLVSDRYGVIIKNSRRVDLFADYALEADGEPGSLDPETWEAYGPSVALYALWWDVLAARLARRAIRPDTLY